MFENVDGVKLLSSYKGFTKPSGKVECRKSNAFILRIKGNVTYNLSNRIVETKEGDIIFSPKGSSYTYETASDTKSEYTSINFDAYIENPHFMRFSSEGFADYFQICNHFSETWKIGGVHGRYKCLSMFYSLLSYLAFLENVEYRNLHSFRIIEPAISYMTEHMYDSDLNVDSLHLLCGISNTYFRKLFHSRFAATPKNYITQKRLSHAKEVLESGDFASVAEVANSVGYNDPLYFSRAFKEKYGTSPSKI